MDRPDPNAEPAGGDRCPQCGHEVGDAWLVCAWCGRQLAAPAELAEGARLSDGRYQILRVIGRGGFGITYEVGDRRLQRRVAMKELFPESAVRHGSLVLTPPQGRAAFRTARDRFLREARVLARFTHPGIVRVYEVFEEHGTAYLCMELLEGRTLIELLQQRGRPFPEADVVDVATRVSAALRPVHAAGVLHRDVNPSNVMVTHHGRIVVIDFGLARDYDQDQTVGMTRVVTPGYAPLEQYRGEGHFGPSTDVYGVAATCYRLATGKVPRSAIERDAGAELAPPRRLNPAISKAVSDAILDGLELEPTHRPQDLDAFLARLGVRRLPDSPRSSLVDTMPPPPPAAPPADGPPSSGPDGRSATGAGRLAAATATAAAAAAAGAAGAAA
ncbi:MAG TPA: protein kinase, partial [Aquihabitans sp.]|nr:protein kinase [Aquihabitans sp.]